MRVLFVNENVGGHATVHHHLREALSDWPTVDARFVDVPRPGLWRRAVGTSVPGLGRLDADLQPLRAQLAAAAWVRSRLPHLMEGVDAVHVYTQNAGLLSAGILRRVPTVVTLDTTNSRNAYRLPYRRPTALTPVTVAVTKPLERRVYRSAQIIIANSEWAAASLREDYGLGEEQVRVLPFGIMPPEPAPSTGCGAAPGTLAGRPRIVFVGRQLERKGGLRLLRLHQQHLADRADLVLVTQERVEAGPGVEVVSDLTPGDRRLWDVLESSAIFAFPSEVDQAPNAVLEAMAAGLPVVALGVAAVPEMVLEGITGRLVDPGAGDDALLAVLTELIDDPRRRARMGAAGRVRFAERYDARRAAAALVASLEEAVARHRGVRPAPSGHGVVRGEP